MVGEKMPRYSVVVPVYRSEDSLALLYTRVMQVFEENYNGDFELILVDDSSPDSSAEKMRILHAQDPRVKCIYLAKNFGQHCATLCGLSYAAGEIIVTLDDDLQHPPEEIPKLIDFLNEHPETDVVTGNYIAKKHSLIRNLGTKLTNFLTSIMLQKDKNLHMTSFRAMRRFIADALCSMTVSSPRIGHLILRTTKHIANVPVKHDPREFGQSGYSFKRLVKDFFKNIINNSDLPLILLGRLGIFSFIISVILLIYYLIRYFVTGFSVAGFATIIMLILAFGGLLLMGIGIIGHYLLLISNEAKKMPLYIVRKEEIEECVKTL